MSRLLSLFAALTGLFLSTMLAAQTPPPAFVPPPLEAENTWNLDLSTGGRVVIQLRPDVAPAHVERIKALTRQGFYNGLTFFRVIDGFMAQGGDPQNSGIGGSTLPNLNAEINGLPHVRGAIGMARAQDMNSANSQFYIMFTPRLQMDRQYTIVGRVVSGMSFVDAIERGEPPPAPSRIVRASLGADNVPPVSADELRAAAAQMAAAQAPAAATARMPGPIGPAEPPPAAGPRALEPVRAANAPPRPRRPTRPPN
jgi:cyclophilin family peptidyl-prolyl cis-trans isomerase